MNKKYIFSESDYNSGDGMMTSIWGPPLWHSLHTISFNFPINPTEEQKEQYFNFYNSLQGVLPCRYCRENLIKNMQVLPLTMEIFKCRYTLSKYIYDLHELINTMLEKKSGLSYEDVRDRYEHFRSRCLENPNKMKQLETKKEKGCTEPLYGVKSKCVLNIVPKDNRLSTFKIDPKCELRRSCKIKKKPTKKTSKKTKK